MTVTPKPMPPLAWFTPRLIDGPENAPWVTFLDPNPEPPDSIFERWDKHSNATRKQFSRLTAVRFQNAIGDGVRIGHLSIYRNTAHPM